MLTWKSSSSLSRCCHHATAPFAGSPPIDRKVNAKGNKESSTKGRAVESNINEKGIPEGVNTVEVNNWSIRDVHVDYYIPMAQSPSSMSAILHERTWLQSPCSTEGPDKNRKSKIDELIFEAEKMKPETGSRVRVVLSWEVVAGALCGG